MRNIFWALLGLDLALTGYLACRAFAADREKRQDEEFDRLLRDNAVDEGFENIMRFSVRGQTGFEPE